MIGEAPSLLGVAERRVNISDGEQRAAQRELFGAPSVAEEAVVADAVESVRQCMQQEAADELVGGQRHDLALVLMPVVAPAEADPAAGERDESAVGDRDAVRVAAEIGQHRRGAGEWSLGVDDPCDRRSPGKENGNVT